MNSTRLLTAGTDPGRSSGRPFGRSGESARRRSYNERNYDSPAQRESLDNKMNEIYGTLRRSSGPFKFGDPIDRMGQLGKKSTHRIPLHDMSDAHGLQNFFICGKEILAGKPTLGKNVITSNGHGQLHLELEGPWMVNEEARERSDPSPA
jgi:hypothetical protein